MKVFVYISEIRNPKSAIVGNPPYSTQHCVVIKYDKLTLDRLLLF